MGLGGGRIREGMEVLLEWKEMLLEMAEGSGVEKMLSCCDSARRMDMMKEQRSVLLASRISAQQLPPLSCNIKFILILPDLLCP